MRPGTGTCGKISATGIPFNIGDAVVISNTQQLYTTTPVSLSLFTIIRIEIKIPELKFGFAR